MKKSNKQKKADADFVKKVGSLTFSFGKKSVHGLTPGDKVMLPCPDCGEPTEVKFMGAVEAKMLKIPIPVKTQEETSFAA